MLSIRTSGSLIEQSQTDLSECRVNLWGEGADLLTRCTATILYCRRHVMLRVGLNLCACSV